MILPQQLAMDIYNCHSEIVRAQGLLEEVEKYLKTDKVNRTTDTLRDAFGRQQNNLELGIPSGHNSRALIRLSPKLGKYIIEAHLAAMKAELVDLSAAAAIALSDSSKINDVGGNL